MDKKEAVKKLFYQGTNDGNIAEVLGMPIEWVKEARRQLGLHRGKWTDSDLLEAFDLVKSGNPYEDVGRELGRTESAIRGIMERKDKGWYDYLLKPKPTQKTEKPEPAKQTEEPEPDEPHSPAPRFAITTQPKQETEAKSEYEINLSAIMREIFAEADSLPSMSEKTVYILGRINDATGKVTDQLTEIAIKQMIIMGMVSE